MFGGRGEEMGWIAAKALTRKLQEPILGRRNNVLNGNPGVVDAVFAADQVLRHQRTVHPGQYVVVQRVHFAEGSAHFAAFSDESGRQGREGEKAFFGGNSGVREREKKVSSSGGMDNGLHSQLRFVHLERWRGINGIMPGAGDEVADHADIGVQSLRRCGAGSAQSRLRRSGHNGWRSAWLRSRCGFGLRCGRGRRDRLGSLRFHLPQLSFERNHTVFEVSDSLQQSRNILSAGLSRRCSVPSARGFRGRGWLSRTPRTDREANDQRKSNSKTSHVSSYHPPMPNFASSPGLLDRAIKEFPSPVLNETSEQSGRNQQMSGSGNPDCRFKQREEDE